MGGHRAVSHAGIVSCGGCNPNNWCDVKTPNDRWTTFYDWHGGEGGSPCECASGSPEISGNIHEWFDASSGDERAGRSTCCEWAP